MVTAEEDSARRVANRQRVLSGETVRPYLVQYWNSHVQGKRVNGTLSTYVKRLGNFLPKCILHTIIAHITALLVATCTYTIMMVA